MVGWAGGQTERILGTIVGDNSEVEDLSDIDDPVWDADYQPPPQEPSSSEDEDPIPQPTEPSRGHKRCCGENKGYRSDRDITRSRTPRRHRQTQQVEADDSNDGPEEPTPGPTHQVQERTWNAPEGYSVDAKPIPV